MPKKTELTNLRKRRHTDLPATIGLVKEVRNELRSEIRRLDSKIGSLDSKIDSVESTLSGKIQEVLVAVHRTQALMEEQRGENRIVLDGLKNLMDRQDHLENEFRTRF